MLTQNGDHYHTGLSVPQLNYTAKLLFHQSPTRHSDYTTQWRPLWSCSHRSLVSDTMTTSETHIIRYPIPWGQCRNPSTRLLVGKCMVTTWEYTRYLLHTQSLCRNQGGTDTRFCSLPLVPLAGERIITTSSLSCHSTVTTWGVLLC